MKPTITVDIGTTQVKTALFDASGNHLASVRQPTPNLRDAHGSTYDVEGLLSIIDRFIRNLGPDQRGSVEAIAITGVGESGGLVDATMTLHSPMILWHDHRGASLIDGLDEHQRDEVYRITGLPPNANYSLSKIAWARRHADPAAQDLKWLNISEYVAGIMTGRRWAEPSLASRTMALDVNTGYWSQAMCDLAGIDSDLLPSIRAASEGQPVTDAYARSVGISADVLVHVAGHDHMVGAVGAGLHPGEILNSTGTTEGLLLLTDSPRLDQDSATSQLANGLSCDGTGYTLFASIPTGGSAFQTLQGMLGMSESMLTTTIDALSERYLAGSIDMARIPLVIPKFRGSPPPHKSKEARGVIAGISTDVQAEELVLGCFLGLAFQFSAVLELFRDQPTLIKVIGPASRNSLWLHLKADVLGANLSVSKFPEVVSRGAQALASGLRSEWASCRPTTVAASESRHAQLRQWRSAQEPILSDLRDLRW